MRTYQLSTLSHGRAHYQYVQHTARKPDGGFVLIPAWVFVAAWWAARTGDLRPVDLRVWLASFESVARRCRVQKGRPVRYTAAELRELTGVTAERSIRSGLRRLASTDLMTWAESGPTHAEHLDHLVLSRPGPMLDALRFVSMHDRRVPVPRPLLRQLCRSNSPSLLAASFGHLLRCMFNGRRTCRTGGLCKASWVATVFGLSERSVKRATASLVASGVLRRERINQRVMNRHGGCSRWNLRWQPTNGGTLAPPARKPACRPACRVTPCIDLSHPRRHAGAGVSLPRGTDNSLSGSENQQPCTEHASAVGVRRYPRYGARSSRGPSPSRAGLGYVRASDLTHEAGLRRLFRRAASASLVPRSEAGVLAFTAAAAHARRVATRTAGGLFATVVRRGLWQYVSGEDEDRARPLAQVIATRLFAQPRRGAYSCTNHAHALTPHSTEPMAPETIRSLVLASLTSVGPLLTD